MNTLRVLILMTCLGLSFNVVMAQLEQSPHDFSVVKLDPHQNNAWAVRMTQCVDNTQALLFNSLVKSEQATGQIESRSFFAPEKLSFWIAGASHQNKNFVQLVDAASGEVLRSEPAPGTDQALQKTWDLVDIKDRSVIIRLIDHDTGDGWAWMAFGRLDPPVVQMPTTAGAIPDDWSLTAFTPETIEVLGVPFTKQKEWVPEREGEQLSINLGVKAKHLYLLGAINSVKMANPGWGGGKGEINFFIGNSIGTLLLNYQSGAVDAIPLIIGYNVWWHDAYQQSHVPLSQPGPERDLLDKVLFVANGIDGWKSEIKDYFIVIKLRDEMINSMTLVDRIDKDGTFVLEGATLDGVTSNSPQASLESTVTKDVDEGFKTWLPTHTIDSRNAYPETIATTLKDLGNRFYTYPEDITEAMIESTPKEITSENFEGPKVRFSGKPEASLMTHIYYENAHNTSTRVEEDGSVHESAKGSTNYPQFGTWIPNLQPFYTAAYTRIRALTVLSEMGFNDHVSRALDYFDYWLMYYPRSFPEIQLGGKPVPGHASVIANQPHVYPDILSKSGWPTRYQVRDFGNPETDGHGMLMLTHWRAWVQLGRPLDWIEKRWEAINEAAEFIPWALENPDLSFSEHGLLYAESEGGMSMVSLYSNMACYFGLLGYVDIAKAAGKDDIAQRWSDIAEKLRLAMEAYFTIQDPQYGDVWDVQKAAGWGYEQGVLAPILFGMDLTGYDVNNRLPAGWAARTRRSYEKIIKNMQPEFCAPAGLGYGQNYFTQSALLFDRMEEATPMVEWLARFCYAPRLEHPFRSPEGITMQSDGSVWRRWGDLGNLYQMAEAVYTIHVLLGIDDLNLDRLVLMPRLPLGWTDIDVAEWPVVIAGENGAVTANLAYKLRRNQETNAMMIEVMPDRPIQHCAIRLGPFKGDGNLTCSMIKPQDHSDNMRIVESGGFRWVWCEVDNVSIDGFSMQAGFE